MVRKKTARVGDAVIVFICVLLILVCLLPVLNVAARSLSSPESLIRNQVLLLPVGLNLEAYNKVLRDPKYTQSLGWTALLTVVCMAVSMIMTVACAYPLTYDHLKGRRFFNILILLTMYFSAGMIPNYMLIKDLKMLDTPWVLILPNCLSVFNMIIMRSFLFGIPDSLRESAELDGAGPIRILVSIYLPLCTSVLATLALFYAVGRWNGFSDALIYIRNTRLYPIQLLLYNILQNFMSVDVGTQEGFFSPGLAETMKSAAVMVATIPILLIYPFLQKYFITGVTIGAVKG